MTDDQLIWRLKQGGLRPDASALLAALSSLAKRGEIRRERDRWHLAKHTALPQKANDNGLPPLAPEGVETLRGIFASFRNQPKAISTDEMPDVQSGPVEVDWCTALTYYAATQRQDPRGNVERFPDQHGQSWQLIHGSGRWWERSEVAIKADAVPTPLREALSRLGLEGTASIGWPVSVFKGSTGAACLPGLLVPITWKLTTEELVLTPDTVSPSLNPAWLNEVRRRTSWSGDGLREALSGGDDAPTFEEIAGRMNHALARLGGRILRPAELASDMALGIEGLRNTAGFFLPDEGTFTRAVAADLDSLVEWPVEQRRGTALAHLLDTAEANVVSIAVAEPSGLTDNQFAAADAALAGPFTVVQGPPGTGKSQTIVSLLCAALAQGQSVLFVARNHRAIDEVEQRLTALLPNLPVLTRGRDASGERDNSFTDALTALTNGSFATDDDRLSAQAASDGILPLLRDTTDARREGLLRDKLGLQLSEFAERSVAIRDALPPDRFSLSLWARLRSFWARLFASRFDADAPIPEGATLAQLVARMTTLRAKFEALAPPQPLEPVPLIAALRVITHALTRPDESTLATLRNRKAELEFQPRGLRLRALTGEDAHLILRHRPIWAITSLSVPARVPLMPGLFDLAVFDESSQCDIASALPVLARAKRAVVVGDPQQLTFIPGLGRAQEHALMDAAGMPKGGRARWAQSINSLYDFVTHRLKSDRVHLLRDQFRSAPQIVDYTNAAFYGGRLVARRDEDEFQSAAGYNPGLHWQNVNGTTSREDGGNVNRAEADWIVSRLQQLGSETTFGGSVGVISPFNAQVGLIRRLADAALDAATRANLKLHVDTVDRWQGGEADVVFFSMVVGRGAPQSAVTFLSRERRRFNVAISRARSVAVVVGDLDWARLCGISHIVMLADRATRPPAPALELSESLWERRMAVALERRGLTFTQQYPVGRRRLDFALFSGDVKLDLEVDGRRWHEGPDGERKTSDRLRDREMIGLGWKVRRFWVHELQSDLEGCLDTIERDIGRQ